MKKFHVGLQLYSIREQMEADMDGALKQVKEMGYDYVEFAGYFGKTGEEVKALLDKHGLTAISVHRAPSFFQEDMEGEIAFLKAIGAKYSAIPHYAAKNYYEDWKGTMDLFQSLGEKLKENGIQLLYHNHDFEFEAIDGTPIIEKMYQDIPNEIMAPEYDTCWVHYAGKNPAEYLKAYTGEMKVVHIKDFVCDKLGGGPVYELIGVEDTKNQSREERGFRFRPIGKGIQNWEEILKACEEKDVDYVIVEQDQWYDEDPMECARQSRAYLKEQFQI